MEPVETQLIARAQSGDDGALEALIAQIRPSVTRQLLRYPVSEEDRRDLLQTSLLQVVRRIHSFRGEASFSTWVFRVTANEALMLMRAQRRQRSRLVLGMDLEDLGNLGASSPQGGEQTGDHRAQTESASELSDALAELPEDDRRIVVAHYHEDRGLQEIANNLRVTESAVRSRLHRARSRLRAILGQTTTPATDGALLGAPAGEAA